MHMYLLGMFPVDKQEGALIGHFLNRWSLLCDFPKVGARLKSKIILNSRSRFEQLLFEAVGYKVVKRANRSKRFQIIIFP